MSLDQVKKIADAILYEGYLLYPYSPSALKNRHRWTFGVLYPEAYCRPQAGADSSWLQVELLVANGSQARLQATVRFLQLVGEQPVEREVAATIDLGRGPVRLPFSFPPLDGIVELSSESLHGEVCRVRARVENHSSAIAGCDRDEVLTQSLLSTHVVLQVMNGDLVSLLDPPPALAGFAAVCRNVGVWPVLAGEGRNWMLASPILLADYPRVAPESAGDHFDGAEIDELLTLRIRTLTDEEKQAMRADVRTRRLLEQVEALPDEHLLRLHGVLRSPGADIRAGDHVRLKPRAGADVFDLVLAGKTATVQKVEQDLEGNAYLAVTVDDDPGRDLGAQGRPGHRFFFRPEEVESLGDQPARNACTTRRILVAGIGNIFLGDDAFGVAVVRQLSQRPLPGEVTVSDFGIRGFDLACALLEDYDLAILVDATQRGGDPGTLYVLEPDQGGPPDVPAASAHDLVPEQVFRLVRQLGGNPRVRLVGCEPASLQPDQNGLSEPVQAAIGPAITLIEKLIAEALAESEIEARHA